MIWELWEHEEDNGCTCLTYRPAAHADPLPGHARNTWSVNASSLIDAMNRYYAHMDWGAYQPMLDADGNPYPEDLEPYPEGEQAE
jgi:hypothetical protein